MPFDAPAAAVSPGFMWKSLFLPAGTQVWMRCGGAEHEALVEGDALLWNGRAVSPTEFANAVAGHARNAWRDLWLLRPGQDADFRLADDLRAELAGERRPLRSRPMPRQKAAPKVAVLSLVPFLIRAGGLRDDRGDVLAILGGSHRTRPGLISRRGLPLDRAAAAAVEAGYFPEHAVVSRGAEGECLAHALASAGRDCETIAERDLLDAIDEELRGRLRWPDGLAPEVVADPGREEADLAAADAEDASCWRALVGLAQDGGTDAVLAFLARQGCLRPGSFVLGDDPPF